jgi:glutamate dehydrogenase
LVAHGELTMKKRNQLLQSMQDEVGEIVLADAYQQAESISVAEVQGVSLVKEQIRFIHALEKNGALDRALEYLPDDETLLEREKQEVGLTCPELSVLIAYAKMFLKEQLADELIANDSYHATQLIQYFPSELRRNYAELLPTHPLRIEIIATALANQMVNEMGCNFVSRLQDETGAGVVEITNAYCAARDIYNLDHIMEKIRVLDNQATTAAQYEVLGVVRRFLRRLSRWILRNHMGKKSVNELIELYKDDVQQIATHLNEVLVGREISDHDALANRWIGQGIDDDMAHYVSRLSSLNSALDICIVAREKGITVQ